MAEIIQKDGTWAFDGEALRLTPGRDRNVGLLRRTLGELLVSLGALAGVSRPDVRPDVPALPRQLTSSPAEDDHDALLRRLRELGELRREGVLTEAEFTMAKQAVLKRM